jgi:hypothetical protein
MNDPRRRQVADYRNLATRLEGLSRRRALAPGDRQLFEKTAHRLRELGENVEKVAPLRMTDNKPPERVGKA